MSSTLQAGVESGTVLVTNDWNTVTFQQAFTDPVVVAGPAQESETDPGVVELADVTPFSFKIRFREWSYLDGIHATESVNYVVAERGVSTLPSGEQIEAGTSDLLPSWSRLKFSKSYYPKPVVLTTIVDNQSAPAAPRVQRWTNGYIELRQWIEEGGVTPANTQLNWIVWPTGGHVDADGLSWKAAQFRTDEIARTLQFSDDFPSPCIVADIATPTANPVTIRALNSTASSIDFRVTEEQSADIEVQLGPEVLSYLLLNCTEVSTDTVAPVFTGSEVEVLSLTQNAATLDWPEATDSNFVSYKVFDGNGLFLQQLSSTSTTVNSLTPETSYTYSVVALDTAGNQSTSLTVTFTTPIDATAPAFIAGELSATDITQSGAVLSWPVATDLAQFDYRLFDQQGVEIARTSQTSLTLSNLTFSTAYQYSVVAVDSYDNTSVSLGVVFSTLADTSVPVFGAGSMTATEVTKTSANLSWPMATDETDVSYHLLNEQGSEVAQTSQSSFELTGLMLSTQYRFSLLAKDNSGNTSVPLEVVFTTQADSSAPLFAAGELEVANITQNGATLSWPLATDESEFTYRLLGADEAQVVSTSINSHTLTDLVPGTQYSYSLVATDVAGNETAPLTITLTTLSDNTAPVFSTGQLQAGNVDRTSATLSWPAATDDNEFKYEVRDGIGNLVAELQETSVPLATLDAGTEYQYSVVARDLSGNASSPLEVSFSTLDADLIAPLFGNGQLNVSDITYTSARLTWPEASDESPFGYKVYASDGTFLLELQATSYSIDSLTADTPYAYSVRAVDSSGNESVALSVSFRTLVDTVAPLFQAGELTATEITQTGVTLQWPVATDDQTVVYQLNDSTGVHSIETSLTAASLDNLEAETEYTFEVVAKDAADNSSTPLSVVFTTPAVDTDAPVFSEGELIASDVRSTSLRLSWPDAIDANLANYSVLDGDGSLLQQVTNNSALIISLSTATEYQFSVVATDVAGNVSPPLSVSVQTLEREAYSPPPGSIFISTTTNATMDNIAVSGNDIVLFNRFSYSWSMFIDASDVGIQKDIDAFAILPDGSFLISMDAPTTLAGVGAVDDSDIVRFEALTLGDQTQGSFSMYFDGSDVGLTTAGEDVNSLTVLESGDLLIGVSGRLNVSGFIANDEDVARFTPTELGATTSGSWQMYFDGSDLGLAAEDLWGVTVRDNTLYMATQSAISLEELVAKPSDILQIELASTGEATAGSYVTPHYFEGASETASAFRIDAIHIGPTEWTSGVGDLEIVSGMDWSLPDSARRADHSGITWVLYNADGEPAALANRHANDVFGVETEQYEQNRFAVLVEFGWNEVSSASGVYDWSSVDAIVDDIVANAAPGVGVFLWPKAYGANIPSWVDSSLGHSFSTDPASVIRQRDVDGNFIFNSALEQFVDAIAEHFSALDRLVHIDMRTAFDHVSGEWSLKEVEPTDTDRLQIEVWQRQYHQMWADAASLNNIPPGKLVTIIAWPHFGGSTLLNESFALGLGQRDGQPSRRQVWYEAYGSSLDSDGYLVVDEQSAAIANSAVRYSELTEFSFVNDNFGPRLSVLERLQAGLFWNLHSRRNWLAVPAHLLNQKTSFPYTSLSSEMKARFDEGQEMIRWAQLELGHTAATANDAWSWTKRLDYTGYNNNSIGTTTAKNVERWLYQRDIAHGGETVAVYRTPKSEVFRRVTSGIVCDDDWCEDYRARRTDKLSGNDTIYYSVDTAFLNVATPILLKVSYYDVPGGEWLVEYTGENGIDQTDTVPMTGTGALRTVTFDLDGFDPAGDFVSEMDFRIRAVGTGDSVIRFTRVIKK